jgi:hypothetical protein
MSEFSPELSAAKRTFSQEIAFGRNVPAALFEAQS